MDSDADSQSNIPGADSSLTPRQQQSHIDNNDFATFDEDEAYPDIYRGTKESTWRRRNADEILLSNSLDQLRAQDLSVHLYNAFKLGQLDLPQTRKQPHQKKHSQDEIKDGSLTWKPPRQWTAWPLHRAIVPRERGYEPGATMLNLPPPYINKPVKPSQLLEEILLAQMLKHAKVKLKDSQERSEERYSRQASRPSGRQSRSTSLSEDSMTTSTSSSSSRHSSRSPGQSPSSIGSEPPTSHSPSLQILTDDERALTLLHPQIRHILSQLDTLLTHLHKVRKSYADVPHGRSPSATDTEHDSGGSSLSRSRGRKRPRTRSLTPAPPSCGRGKFAEENEEREGGRRKRNLSSRSERSRRRQLALGLRGWEDVMGMVAIMGWDEEVVRRVGTRCEELFGEDTQGANGEKDKKEKGKGGGIVSWSALLDGRAGHNAGGGESGDIVDEDGVHLDGFLQPIEAKRSWRKGEKKVKRNH